MQDGFGKQHEVEPLSVLDFYVHESRQKCGYGKRLFEFMLKVSLYNSSLLGMHICYRKWVFSLHSELAMYILPAINTNLE